MSRKKKDVADLFNEILNMPAPRKLIEGIDMKKPVNEFAMASFLSIHRRRVEAWRRSEGVKGIDWDVFGGDVCLTRKGAIQCALDLGHGISVQNACSWAYTQQAGHRVMMKGTCPNPRVVKAVKLSDGLLVVVRVRNPMDYPIGAEFMALDNGTGGYADPGNFNRKGW